MQNKMQNKMENKMQNKMARRMLHTVGRDDILPSLTVKKIKLRWNPYSIKVSQRCCFVFKYSLFSLLGHG